MPLWNTRSARHSGLTAPGSTFTAPTGGEDGAIGESDEGDDISFTTVVWNGDDF